MDLNSEGSPNLASLKFPFKSMILGMDEWDMVEDGSERFREKLARLALKLVSPKTTPDGAYIELNPNIPTLTFTFYKFISDCLTGTITENDIPENHYLRGDNMSQDWLLMPHG